MRAPSWFSACDRNGSGIQTASTWPFASAERIAGNGITTSLIEFGSMPELVERAFDHDLADALEGVDRDRLAREVLRRADRARALDHDVLPVVGDVRAFDLAGRATVMSMPFVFAMNAGVQPM